MQREGSAGGLERELLTATGTLDLLTASASGLLLGSPGTGKTRLTIGLVTRACQRPSRTWVTRLADAHHTGATESSSACSAATCCSSST